MTSSLNKAKARVRFLEIENQNQRALIANEKKREARITREPRVDALRSEFVEIVTELTVRVQTLELQVTSVDRNALARERAVADGVIDRLKRQLDDLQNRNEDAILVLKGEGRVE